LLESAIIVILAAAFFLVLRHYPEVSESKISFWKDWQKKLILGTKSFMAQRKKRQIEKIKQEISRPEPEITFDNVNKLPELSIQQKYSKLPPELVRILCSADEALINNDLREAEDKAIEAITKDKRCAGAYVIIGKVAFSRGEFDDSKEAYKTALKCDADQAEAYYGLGQINHREENYQECIDNYSNALNLEKSRADWYADFGNAYMEIRQFAKAAKAFKKASSIDIENREYKDLASEAEEKQRAHASVARMK